MRLFTAIQLPDPVREHLAGVIREASAVTHDVRWTLPQKLHLTLKFIGEVPDPDVPHVINTLETVVIESPITLHCEGIVCFPPHKPARIIAAGVSGDTDQLSTLFEQIETALEGICQKEHRPYRPHVTLGRCKMGLRQGHREKLLHTVQHLPPGPAFTVDTFALISSDKGIYTVCHHFG